MATPPPNRREDQTFLTMKALHKIHCAFCGTHADASPEDIVSRWISRYLQREQNRRTFPHTIHSKERVLENHPTAQRFKFDAPVVCTACNNGWMSGIEKLAQRIFEPIARTPSCSTILTDEQCITLAAWATIKAIVADHWSLPGVGGKPFFMPGTRRRFMDSLLPPSGSRVWIARVEDIKVSDIEAVYTRVKTKELKGLTYIFTFAVLPVVIQFQATKTGAGKLVDSSLVPFVIIPQNFRWPDVALQLWPYVGEVTWPPLRHIPKGHFELFSRRFSGNKGLPSPM